MQAPAAVFPQLCADQGAEQAPATALLSKANSSIQGCTNNTAFIPALSDIPSPKCGGTQAALVCLVQAQPTAQCHTDALLPVSK